MKKQHLLSSLISIVIRLLEEIETDLSKKENKVAYKKALALLYLLKTYADGSRRLTGIPILYSEIAEGIHDDKA